MRRLAIPLLAAIVIAVACGGAATPSTAPEKPAATTESSPDTVPPRIDTHLHIGEIAAAQSPETLAASAAALVGLLDDRGVDIALVVVVPNPGGGPLDEYAATSAAVATQDRLRLMAGGATLERFLQGTPPADVTDAIRAEFVAEAEALIVAGAAGFGEMISMHPCLSPTHSYQVVPADHPLMLALADAAARLDVPIDLHMEAILEDMTTPQNLLDACDQNPTQLPATVPGLEQLLSHNREARIVWQHIGWDNFGHMTPELVGSLLDRHSNLYVALRVETRATQVSSSLPMPNRIITKTGELDPAWLTVIERHPDRFVLGSDEFVTPDGSPDSPIASFDLTWSIVDLLPADLAAAVGGVNAARVYRLEG